MILVVCLDERKGMLFNNRRLSRDRLLIEDLLKHKGDAPLYIAPFSKALFAKYPGAVIEAEDPLTAAGADDYVFNEHLDASPHLDRITSVIIYYWNRHYPSDMTFNLDMSSFHLSSTTEFVGSSHEKITKEVWNR